MGRPSSARDTASLDPEGGEAAFYRSIIDSMSDGVYFVDPMRRITFWSAGAERLTGYRAADVVGHACHEGILNHVDDDGVALCGSRCPLLATMRDGNVRDVHVWMHHHDGDLRPVHLRAAAIRSADTSIIGAVETFTDDTNAIVLRDRLRDAQARALLDPLTAVGNRRLLGIQLSARFARYEQLGDTFGVVLLDVDHFKDVNDRYGHDAGDRVIQAVAKTMAATARRADTVVRFGGDEFLMLVDSPTLDGVAAAADRCRTMIGETRVVVDDNRICVRASVGAALVEPGDTPAKLLARADALLYQAKAAGRGVTCVQPSSRSVEVTAQSEVVAQSR
jgi:diguanylate cyclase (GGDEF)-like protein/PAS domain S-box-containing protein